jgi:hypothetical protein
VLSVLLFLLVLVLVRVRVKHMIDVTVNVSVSWLRRLGTWLGIWKGTKHKGQRR